MADLGSAPGSGRLLGYFGVTDAGVIIGSTDEPRAWYYDGAFHLIPLPGSDNGNHASAINSSNEIVGYGSPSHHPFKFAISGAVLTDLGVAKAGGGSWSQVQPLGINAGGDVVGWAQ